MSSELGGFCKAKLHTGKMRKGEQGLLSSFARSRLRACARIFFVAACGHSESFHARDAMMCAKGCLNRELPTGCRSFGLRHQLIYVY